MGKKKIWNRDKYQKKIRSSIIELLVHYSR